MNDHEERNRERKASALLRAVLREHLTLDQLLGLNADGWTALAKKAETPSPSFLTMELVIENLEHCERGRGRGAA